jgi:hypothetical protein
MLSAPHTATTAQSLPNGCPIPVLDRVAARLVAASIFGIHYGMTSVNVVPTPILIDGSAASD